MNPEDLIRLAHNIDLPFAAGKPPPSEFRIFASGKIETTKGAFLFDAKAAEAVMASAAEWGNDYPVDYDHAMGSFLALDPANSGKAAGWFTPELRNGELWATSVSWTPAATKMLGDREYRYTSPSFLTEKEGGRIMELVNVALTNLPATKKHTPLMASRNGEGKETPVSKNLAIALSLAEDASEAQMLIAISNLRGFSQRVLDDVGAKTQAEALGILTAWKGNAEKIATLSAKVAAHEQAAAAAEVETLIAEGKTAGKITPSSEAQVRQLAKDHGAGALKGFLAVALAAPKPLTEPANEGAGELTPQELAMCTRNGFDPKVVLANKKAALAAGTYPTA